MAQHKILDPIHAFIYFTNEERFVLDSWPVQRLRHIHQNALAYHVYPGAVHSRFEHSLGVMELAGRVFDVISAPENRHPECVRLFPNEEDLKYWRQVLRLAALSHDLGHLPFSHAAEEHLLPKGMTHETLSKTRILSEEMVNCWQLIPQSIDPKHIAKLAVGEKRVQETFSSWEKLLCEVITGDVFGVDRMDYLLRDSYYAGIPYGKFDHHRLIDTLRILPDSSKPENFTLGIVEGGLRSAEDLLLSRYFMFKQVYYHEICRVYSIHLSDFMLEWTQENPEVIHKLPCYTDHEIMSEMFQAAQNSKHLGHQSAKRILKRTHYKLLYKPQKNTQKKGMVKHLYQQAILKFGTQNLKYDSEEKSGKPPEFPVLCSDGTVESSKLLSSILLAPPSVDLEYLYINPEIIEEGKRWLKSQELRKYETLC